MANNPPQRPSKDAPKKRVSAKSRSTVESQIKVGPKIASSGDRTIEVGIGEIVVTNIFNPSSDAAIDKLVNEFGLTKSQAQQLKQQIREKANDAELPTLEDARQTWRSYDSEQAVSPQHVVRGILNEMELLKALAVLNRDAYAEFASLVLEFEEKVVPAAHITELKRSIKAVLQDSAPAATATEQAGGPYCPYIATPDGFYWCDEGKTKHLTNFTAEIVEEIREYDGLDKRCRYRVAVDFDGTTSNYEMEADSFDSMRWIKTIGPRAIIYPGSKERARVAIRELSPDIQASTVHTHTGWHEKESGEWIYLHAGGGLGADGVVDTVKVRLDGELARYSLPEPPTGRDLKRSVKAMIQLRQLADRSTTCSLEGAAFRSVLCEPLDSSLFITGRTGSGKSELTARYQQSFGSELTARAFPGSWSSTANSLEALAHVTKDALFTIDDFCPRGSKAEISRYNAAADRVIRAQRNNAGRQRLGGNNQIQATKVPRSLLISTGEDIPDGHSLRASMMILELAPGDLDWDLLSDCQRLGEEGAYAQTMAAFVKWVARQFDEIRSRRDELFVKYRERTTPKAVHARTPELAANLLVGSHLFLDFCLEMKCITERQYEKLLFESIDAISKAAAQQQRYLTAADPVRRYLEIIKDALSNGDAYLADSQGGQPDVSLADASGWRRVNSGGAVFEPQGRLIGWLSGDGVYLDPSPCFQVAVSGNTEQIPLGQKTLHKRMRDDGLLASTDKGRDKITVRRTLDGKRRQVLHLRASDVINEE